MKSSEKKSFLKRNRYMLTYVVGMSVVMLIYFWLSGDLSGSEPDALESDSQSVSIDTTISPLPAADSTATL